MQAFFPLGWQHYLLGGMCIGSGIGLLFIFTGRIGGMSSLFSATWSYFVRNPFFQQGKFINTRGWRLVYALGVVLGAFAWWMMFGNGVRVTTQLPAWQLLLGGLLTGYGARLGGGCTSGHGVCGLGWLRLPSLLAVITFMTTGIITANLITRFL